MGNVELLDLIRQFLELTMKISMWLLEYVWLPLYENFFKYVIEYIIEILSDI